VRVAVLFCAAAFSAFFSGAETALFTLRPEDFEFKGGGSLTRRIISALRRNPDRLLTTIVFSNMVANLLFFSVSYFLIVTHRRHMPPYLPALLSAGSLLFIILFCEVIPKNLAVVFARPFSMAASYPIYLLQKTLWVVLAPIERLASVSSSATERLLPPPPPLETDELQKLIELSEEEGVVEEDVGKMIAEVLELSDIALREILVPRVDMVCCSIDAPREDIEDIFRESKHTLLPVYDGSMDRVAGVIHVRDFFFCDEATPITKLIRPVPFIPESASAENALRRMRAEQCRMVFVVDEYGALEGLVTIEDITEEIVGAIGDEYDGHSPPAVQKLSDSRYRLRGDLGIREWKEIFSPADEPQLPVDTVGGLVMALLGRIPKTGDNAAYKNLNFVVESMVGRRIKYVILELH